MARSRNIKPGFFTNEDLVELDFATRLLFAGLWTVADREGRLQDRPKKIKIDLFPADNLDIDVMLQALHDAKFIVRYEVNGAKYVQIATWSKHQNPHHTEKASEIPGVNGEVSVKDTLKPKDAPIQDGGNLADSLLLIPDSLIPDSKEKSPRKRAPSPSRPDDISETVWQDFLAIRKAKRAPLTDTAMDGIKREAAKAEISLPEAITACCEFGWQGFNAGWYAERTAGKSAVASETAYQRSARLRVAEISPELARAAPGQQNPTDYFRTFDAPTLEIAQ